jgi:hypothetical protein
MIVKTGSDMGNIKIFNEGLSCFFHNGYGDGINKVEIREKPSARNNGDFKETNKYEFLGHFTVKNKPVYLGAYDCDDRVAYEFKKTGRYWVYLKKEQSFLIEYMDEETHC